MYEVLLTRVFSVTMWYHFAFVAISVALFGTTLGALIVQSFSLGLALAGVDDHYRLLAVGALNRGHPESASRAVATSAATSSLIIHSSGMRVAGVPPSGIALMWTIGLP